MIVTVYTKPGCGPCRATQRALTAAGILREVGEGAGVRHRWFADGILKVLDPAFAS